MINKMSLADIPSSTNLPDSLDLIPVVSSNRSKAGKKAKRKGSSYERTLCKSFSNFWGAKFFRTPMSGGSQLKHDYNLAGDISTPDETFPYHVEAKNQEALKGFHTIFTSAKCPVWKWWQQCTTECPRNKIPALVFTKNFMPSFVMVPYLYASILEAVAAEDVGAADIHNSFKEFIRVRDCVVMTLKRFLIFNKRVHQLSSERYLSWKSHNGAQYEVFVEMGIEESKNHICRTIK